MLCSQDRTHSKDRWLEEPVQLVSTDVILKLNHIIQAAVQNTKIIFLLKDIPSCQSKHLCEKQPHLFNLRIIRKLPECLKGSPFILDSLKIKEVLDPIKRKPILGKKRFMLAQELWLLGVKDTYCKIHQSSLLM